VPRQDSQRKGRKSSWLQYVYWQWAPIKVGSFSSIVVNESSGVGDLDEDAMIANIYKSQG
jgi:hypothetical protein